jgi:hypothetical protein
VVIGNILLYGFLKKRKTPRVDPPGFYLGQPCNRGRGWWPAADFCSQLESEFSGSLIRLGLQDHSEIWFSALVKSGQDLEASLGV